MKSSDSTEMDRLLRRYARRTGETLRATADAGDEAKTNPTSGSHLDADEMNAYAENALPEAARSRYFAHLADCETCRKLVTELTLAASVSNEGKARVAALETKPSRSWRKWLAAIFSPPVLRYGVPALALFAVIIVAIIAMRSQRDAGSVAQNTVESRSSAPGAATDSKQATQNTTATEMADNHSNSNAATFRDQQSPAAPGIVATPSAPSNAPLEENSAPVVSQETVAKSATSPADDNKAKSGEFGVGRKREQEVVTSDAPPPEHQTVVSKPAPNEPRDRDRRDEPKPSKAADKDAADEMVIDGRAATGAVANSPQAKQDRSVVGGNATTTARAAKNQPRRRPYAETQSAPAADATSESERKESGPATRSAGGRQFQKRGGAWVDTAYNSSRSTTNIRRGSEQYRALVADEPGLRSIAEQLGGEVIVVWKTRTYRFY